MEQIIWQEAGVTPHFSAVPLWREKAQPSHIGLLAAEQHGAIGVVTSPEYRAAAAGSGPEPAAKGGVIQPQAQTGSRLR